MPSDDAISAGARGACGALVPLIVDSGNRVGKSNEDSSGG